MKTKRIRKNFTLRPSAIKALEKLARDLDMSMSRVIEAGLDALRDKRAKLPRSIDNPRTWGEAQVLLDSLPNKSDLDKEKQK